MSARFRFVHFVPDPFSGGRVPLAALVERDGRVAVVPALSIPGPTCLGGDARAEVAQLLLDDLCDATSFSELPDDVAPHAVLGDAHVVPIGVDDPLAWVQELFKPQQIAKHTARRPTHRRSTYGYAFFRSQNVDRFVRRRYQPGRVRDGLLPYAKQFGSVSHYVAGESDLLLMEPVLATRHTFADDLSGIAKLFAAYGSARDPQADRAPRLIAYVLDQGSRARRHEAIDALGPVVDQVVDTSDDNARKLFVARIRDVGVTGDPQLWS